MEFYFLRHGLIDYPAVHWHDTPDVPLNDEGKRQATAVRPVIERLPIRTICVSPMIRAKETMKIACVNLQCPIIVIDELHECSEFVWNGMCSLDSPSQPEKVEEAVHHFMNRAVLGMQKALLHPGPVLIIAHGGIHWAFCHQHQVEHPTKAVANCVPVHFSYETTRWKATLI